MLGLSDAFRSCPLASALHAFADTPWFIFYSTFPAYLLAVFSSDLYMVCTQSGVQGPEKPRIVPQECFEGQEAAA